jgi:hypothetical protein
MVCALGSITVASVLGDRTRRTPSSLTIADEQQAA